MIIDVTAIGLIGVYCMVMVVKHKLANKLAQRKTTAGTNHKPQ